MDRRNFLGSTAGAALAALTAGKAKAKDSTGGKKLNVLVLGGTNFVGPAIVREAQARGHEVTLFNRGITRQWLFPDVEKLRGNRQAGADSDLAALKGNRQWDAVIDTMAERADLAMETATLLQQRTAFYYFLSTIAVYRNFNKPGLVETDETRLNEPGWYGGQKAIAEKQLAELLGDRLAVGRCGPIKGPMDPGADWHYWLRRIADNSRVLGPGSGDDPIQHVDVRDVASFIFDSIEQRLSGVWNLTGHWTPLTMREFLEGARNSISSNAEIEWVETDFLLNQQKVRPFDDMPLWVPQVETKGFMRISSAKAHEAGWKPRPVEETTADAWLWYRSHFFKGIKFPHKGKGLSLEREQQILEAWDKRKA